MKYMVMECHLSYAVVLDEDGRFLNVANRHYEVGQTVTDVVEMQDSQPVIETKPKTHYKWIGSIAAMAACLMLIVTAVFQFGMNTPYGSVYMTINPEVQIDVNKNDVVIDIEGLNEDGRTLIEDYSYKKKDLDLVMDELIDLAIEMGYLHEGGQITLTLDADSNEWVVKKIDSLESHLNEHLTNKLSVTIDITNKKPESSGVTIPVGPESSTPDTNYGETDYGETTNSPSTNTTKPSDTTGPSQSDYDDTDYGPNNDGVTDYDDTDYGPNNDGVTDYDDTDYGPNNDGVTDYEDSSGSGDSGYGDNDYGDDDSSGDSNYGDNGNSNYDDDDADDD